MQVLYQRCAAVDVGKDVIAVAVRVPGDGPDGRRTVKRTFKTFYGVLAEAARWLAGLGVTMTVTAGTGLLSQGIERGQAGSCGHASSPGACDPPG
jgi:hypothetical protein